MTQNRYYSSLTKPTVTTVDPGAAGTTLTVADTTSYSGLDSTFPYTLAVNWGLGDQELVSVTARPSGTTFTVTRGVGGTTGKAHAVGATVFLSVYDADLTEAAAHRGSNASPTTTGVHGVTGNVVGDSDTQTLSNKTVLHAVASYSANHTATATEEIILIDASGGNRTITLPTAVGITGQSYTVKRTDNSTNTVTVATTSSQTIDGNTTFDGLQTDSSYVQVVSDGSGWQVVDYYNVDGGRWGYATGTTALGTGASQGTATTITGVAVTIGAGTWHVRAVVNIVNSGSPTSAMSVNFSGTATTVNTWERFENTGTAFSANVKTAFSQETTLASGQTYTFEATVVVTASGTVQAVGRRTVAGTSATVQVGSYMVAQKIG